MATNNSVIEKPKCATFAEARMKAKETYSLASKTEFSSEAIRVLKGSGCKIQLLPDNLEEVTRLNVRIIAPDGKAIIPTADIITLAAWKEKATGVWRVQTKKSMEEFLPVYWAYAFCHLTNPFGLVEREGDDIDDSMLDNAKESTTPAAATVPAGNGGSFNVADAMSGLMK